MSKNTPFYYRPVLPVPLRLRYRPAGAAGPGNSPSRRTAILTQFKALTPWTASLGRTASSWPLTLKIRQRPVPLGDQWIQL